MRKFLVLSSSLTLLSFYNIKKSKCANESFERYAICVLKPDNSECKGVVHFRQKNIEEPTTIRAKFTGLSIRKKHGFHIHEFGDLSEGCKTAGPHYNPTNRTHGGPDDEERHFGDLGNLLSNDLGEALYERTDHLVSLFGKYSVVGRSCVVHEDEDDLGRGNFEDSKTTGHSGRRIACGIIALTGQKELLF
jgi:Cu-Zn family superoxide dismutase